jgi:ABC-type nitrate/sulfonate/bicarbonate transport system permease component
VTGFDGAGSLIRRGGWRAAKPSAPRSRKFYYRWISVALWVGLVMLWEVGARSGAMPTYVVAPSIIAMTLARLLADGELLTHVSASLIRVAAGLAVGSTLGTLIGLLAGINRPVELYFDPLISLTYPVPKIAILPLLMAWLGIGDASKIAIIAMAVFYPTFINAYYGAKGVKQSHLRAAQNMGASQKRIFWHVIFPSALPQILTGLRIAIALSFVVLFAAEMIGANTGLGYLITFAENNLRFDMMYASLVTIAVIGLAADRVLMAVRARLLLGRERIVATR